MKEYLKEQNMRRENDPVSTTVDVGLNNNQIEGQSESITHHGVTKNYHCVWSIDLGPSEGVVEGWERDSTSYESDESESTIGDDDWIEYHCSDDWTPPETSGNFDYFANNTETRDDNEFNNNEAVHNSTEKIFYEKPKLILKNLQYLADSILPSSTVKCMRFINSPKVLQILEDLILSRKKSLIEPEVTVLKPEIAVLEPEATILKPEITALEPEITVLEPEVRALNPEITVFEREVTSRKSEKNPSKPQVPKNSIIKNNENVGNSEIAENKLSTKSALNDDKSTVWPLINENEIEIDVEIVELTKSVKDIIQFPEIEEITETGKLNDTNESTPDEEAATIEHIDLIREAKELTREENNCAIDNISADLTNVETEHSVNFYENSYDEQTPYAKIEEIDLLSSIGRDIGVDLEKYVQPVPDVIAMETVQQQATRSLPSLLKDTKTRQDTNKLVDHEMPDVSGADARKKEKMARNQARRRQTSASTQNRRPDKRRADHIADGGPGGFDVYNIETAMPKIDLDAIESHLRAAREEERRENERVAEVVEAVAAGREPDTNNRDKEDLLARFNKLLEGDTNVSYQRRNDREEIRRRLAMGPDAEDLRAERGRKPSLQSRLQSGMNLQICFMNETPSDTESPGSESDLSPGPVGLASYPKLQQQNQHPHRLASRPQILSLPSLRVETGSASVSSMSSSSSSTIPLDEADFFARQARLQTEARMALAQAKEMAHMQMEVERQRLKQSPITEMVRSSLEKVGVQLGEDRRRLSRVLLTELNVAQLQVVANDLHARIAMLNEALVEGLLRRDDLHMEQDSMLVDVEDLTRYLGAKQESLKIHSSSKEHRHQQQQQHEQILPTASKNRGHNRGMINSTKASSSLTREKK